MFIYENVTVVTTAISAAYSMQETDTVIVIKQGTGAAIQVNLVASPISGKSVIIKDGKGDAGSNNITIAPAAGTIDGASTLVLSSNYGHTRLIYNGTEWGAA